MTKSRKGILSKDTQGSNLEEGIKANLEVKIYQEEVYTRKKSWNPQVISRDLKDPAQVEGLIHQVCLFGVA